LAVAAEPNLYLAFGFIGEMIKALHSISDIGRISQGWKVQAQYRPPSLGDFSRPNRVKLDIFCGSHGVKA
jgi:hypothetical protein